MTDELKRALERLIRSSRKAHLTAGPLPEDEDEEEDDSIPARGITAAPTGPSPPSPVLPVAESPERASPGPGRQEGPP